MKAGNSMGEMSFCELKSREIVNELDGRKLGRVIDLVFSPANGCILGIVAPLYRRTFFFSKGQEVYIPFKNIIKIGPDVILVRLTPQLSQSEFCYDIKKEEHCGDKHKDGHSHDHDGHGRGYDGYGHSGHDKHGGHDKHDDHKPHSCDNRCEKCMLFDCEHRWKKRWF